MADIAQKLGISIVSVSKGLAGKDGVSEEMRAKILETAAQMGYVAPKTRKEERGSSGNVGILVADRFVADNAFYPALYRQAMVHLAESGYSSIMEIVSPEAESKGLMPAMVQGNKVDGIIFMGELRRSYLKKVISSGLPFILLDFYDEELEADSVTSDNVAGAFRITNAILKSGSEKSPMWAVFLPPAPSWIGFWATVRRSSRLACPTARTGGWMTGMWRGNSFPFSCPRICRMPSCVTATRWLTIW
jgi:LacI family transcriptional regulator